MTTPLISVVIPTLNNASLLRQTLDGVKSQTASDVEIIVVDDGSTDNTGELVRNYDPRIVYCYQSNQRQAAARNKGVSLARGYYIAFCDHDDVWNERHLESLLHCFNSHPGTGMAFDNVEFFGHGVAPRLFLEPRLTKSLNHKKISLNFLLWRSPIASMSVVMFKKDSFQKIQGLSENVGIMDDFHFYIRMAASWELRYVNYVGCRKRISDSNLSRLTTNLKELNVIYLEDIRRNYPEVKRAVGTLSFRLRLGRKYFKLGRYYSQTNETKLAAEMFWKAYKSNFFNPRYLFHYAKMSKE
ncbi:MAG: glycosyltransferase family 2 protein [Candidatus Binatia bacterium]